MTCRTRKVSLLGMRPRWRAAGSAALLSAHKVYKALLPRRRKKLKKGADINLASVLPAIDDAPTDALGPDPTGAHVAAEARWLEAELVLTHAHKTIAQAQVRMIAAKDALSAFSAVDRIE